MTWAPAIPALLSRSYATYVGIPLSEPFDDLFLPLVPTGTASIDAKLGIQPLLALVEAELRRGHGIPDETVALEQGDVRNRGSA